MAHHAPFAQLAVDVDDKISSMTPEVVYIDHPLPTPSPGMDNKFDTLLSPSATMYEKASDDAGSLFSNQNNRKPIWKQWLVEGLLCLASLGSFIIITTVLAVHNGKALPEMPIGITLNTFLAFFTTFTKAAFMVPISEALSQWKWNLLVVDETKGQSRSLSTFGTLDSASRGIWGSWMVLRDFKWRHFISLAAFFSMISIFTSPITQQMIAYKTRPAPIPNGIADVPITRTYTQDPAGIVHPEELTQAVFRGMSSHPSTPILPVAATCGAANCTFSRYTTLAMCMKMRDITPLLTVTELQNTTSPMWTGGRNWERAVLAGNGTTAWNASLPNGISFITPLSYSFALTGHNETLSFTTPADQDANYNALAHYFAIWSNAGNVSYPGFDRASNPTPWPFIAYEVLYHLCVNTYETTFSGGQSNTTLVSSSAVPAARADNEPLYNLGCVPKRNLIFDTCDYLDLTANRTYLADPTDPAAPPFAMDREVGASLTLKLYFDVLLTFLADGIGRNAAVYNNRNPSTPPSTAATSPTPRTKPATSPSTSPTSPPP
ncbi:hypothetical protein B0T18DRAFT_385298 [Schizothecium vesticola]|uniref:Uncharacterized protein n=1 Tax=Schizothecium vesticola TaxID=314040 RepID=A0AA40F8Q9_9PEZI|nr:hypothetical protein B0T18DRAFT_385298 [Schizothecium vesticola]